MSCLQGEDMKEVEVKMLALGVLLGTAMLVGLIAMFRNVFQFEWETSLLLGFVLLGAFAALEYADSRIRKDENRINPPKEE